MLLRGRIPKSQTADPIAIEMMCTATRALTSRTMVITYTAIMAILAVQTPGPQLAAPAAHPDTLFRK